MEFEFGHPPVPVGRQIAGGVSKNVFIDRSKSRRIGRLAAENLCPSATVRSSRDSRHILPPTPLAATLNHAALDIID